jgi:hypothetical protein
LEAITTKKCQEAFHLESLETLGDSFLKYAASQQLFKTYQNEQEGFLSAKKEKIISNVALCKFGCDRKLPVNFCFLIIPYIFLLALVILMNFFSIFQIVGIYSE